VAAKKKVEKKGEVTIRVDGQAGEHRYFNRFSIGVFEGMVQVKLFFLHPESRESDSTIVMSALATLDDCAMVLPSLKGYIGKIGAPPANDPVVPFSSSDRSSPIMFQHLGVISKVGMGELVFSQFSHRNAVETSENPGSSVQANVYGAYTSSREVHKKFIFDFVETVDKILKNRT